MEFSVRDRFLILEATRRIRQKSRTLSETVRFRLAENQLLVVMIRRRLAEISLFLSAHPTKSPFRPTYHAAGRSESAVEASFQGSTPASRLPEDRLV
jgi:hypothetical protein